MAGFKSGVFWGLVFGGVAGIMNAPRPGKETRLALKDYLETAKTDGQDLKNKVDHFQSLIDRIQNQGLKSVNELSEEIQVDIRHFMENNQPRINRIQRRLMTLSKHLQETKKDLRPIGHSDSETSGK